MPYPQGPYSAFPTLPAPETTTLVAARAIDPETGRYKVNADGSYPSMDPTAQRVILALAFDGGPPPEVATPQAYEERAQRLRAALEPLAAGDEPAVRVNAVTVDGDAPGSAAELVDYRNLHTDPTDAEVTL